MYVGSMGGIYLKVLFFTKVFKKKYCKVIKGMRRHLQLPIKGKLKQCSLMFVFLIASSVQQCFYISSCLANIDMKIGNKKFFFTV